MQQTFDWWKPDESDFVIQDNILIGQATLYNTPESKYEHLPLKKTNYILAMDARIDNREELAKELELPNKPLQEIGDSEFILASYRKWGKECADKLLGDFAFVIWDEAKQELFCARDFIGVRPFYYYVDDEKFIFGSDLKALSQHPDIPLDIRDESVANYIVNRQLLDKKHTFFKSINKLEGGCYMYISKSSYQTTRYWHPNKVKKRKLPNEQAYMEELRRLLEDSVKVRLRTDYGVSSHLSGGLDSSPLAVIASRELKKQNPNYRLPVFTWIHKYKTQEDYNATHEWKYIESIAKQENMELHYHKLSPEELKDILITTDITINGGHLYLFEPQIRQQLMNKDIRTMMSGWGGDEFISNHGYASRTEMLIKGEWKSLYLAMKYWHQLKQRNIKSYLSLIYRKLVIPIIPNQFYCYLPKVICKKVNYPSCFKKYFPLIKNEEKNKTYIFEHYNVATIKNDLIRAWRNGHIQARLEVWSQEDWKYKMTYTYPLLDKRLVEFSLTIPTKYAFHECRERYLYKKVLESILPLNIIYGTHKKEEKLWESTRNIVCQSIDIIRKEKKDFYYTQLKMERETCNILFPYCILLLSYKIQKKLFKHH